MLANYISVNILGINRKVVAKQITKSCSIERCACSDNPRCAKTTQLKGNSCHYVNRICCNKEYTVKSGLYYRPDDRTEYFNIPLKQIKACFAFLLSYAC